MNWQSLGNNYFINRCYESSDLTIEICVTNRCDDHYQTTMSIDKEIQEHVSDKLIVTPNTRT